MALPRWELRGAFGWRAGARSLVVASLIALPACGGSTGAPAARPTPISEAQSAAMKPADPHLAQLYETSCKACHTVRDTGAPLTGDREAWDVRWAKGEKVLTRNAVAGLNGMPPGGQCFACKPADYDALIRLMAGR
jgi:cytochrome c5